ncbi:MAG: glycine--tRNA ligase [Verrucomicrobiota bacterium]
MGEPKVNELMEKIVSLCKRRGFVYPSSEIYGGINGFWDYGPLGAELKRNVKELWWTRMTRLREDVVGLEATIIMHPRIWKASGHVDTFSDPMADCLLTRKRFRADQIEPQSGTAYHYTGATDPVSGKASAEPYAVLLPPGKPPESARKLAVQFYQSRGLGSVELQGERPEKVENSQRFNPDNGSLLTEPRPFNLMFKTYVGPVADEDNVAYLRPETAQAIFAQFKNVLETSRQKVPFGIAQMGKAFRNEVTPRNFTFRSREFEQMELEFFIKPDEVVEALCGRVARPEAPGHPGEPRADWGWQMWHQYWVEERIRFYESIGLPRTSLEEYWQKPAELAHYARATVDLLYKFPFGTQELEGIAARGDFDLSQHERSSGKPQGVFDEELRTAWAKLAPEVQQRLSDSYFRHRHQYLLRAGAPEAEAEREAREDAAGLAKGQYIPHVIEPSAGVDRLILALLANAFTEVTTTDDKGRSETRVVMRFHPSVAPMKVGVFPLLKNKPELVAKAREVFGALRGSMLAFYDDAGAIGRRYARQDEAGTPFCVTVDFDTLGETPELKDTVTVRRRDDGSQQRVPIASLRAHLLEATR